MMKLLSRILFGILAIITLVAALAAIEYFGGQPMGLFSGSRPTNLGYTDGKFAPPPWKPNCVSSTVDKADKHYIEPLHFSGAPSDAWKKLRDRVQKSANVTVVSANGGYLYAEFKSAGLGFVDDVEFALDEKTSAIQVRSASRLGIRDFGVNRARIDGIRAQFSK